MYIFASLEEMRNAHPGSIILFSSPDLNLTPYPSLIPGIPSALAFDLTPWSPLQVLSPAHFGSRVLRRQYLGSWASNQQNADSSSWEMG